MKATERYFPVVLFVMLYKLQGLTFQSADGRRELVSEMHTNLSLSSGEINPGNIFMFTKQALFMKHNHTVILIETTVI